MERETAVDRPAGQLYLSDTPISAALDSLAEARWEAMRAKPSGASPYLAAETAPDFADDRAAEEHRKAAEERGKAAEKHYRDTREAFEQTHGSIDYEFWTSGRPGGVVLATKTEDLSNGGMVRRVRRRVHFSRFTDYLNAPYPEASELLYAGDALAAICEEVLRGPTQRIALTQIYTAASQLLSSLDADAMRPQPSYASDAPDWAPTDEVMNSEEAKKERARREHAESARSAAREAEEARLQQEREQRLHQALLGYRRALARADRFYRAGAAQSAQYFYFRGMLFGAVVVSLMAFVLAAVLVPFLAWLWDLPHPNNDTAAGFAAAAAGSLGAIVSVTWRMSAGTFGKEAVFGADNLFRLGAFRPFIGAMFGFILYVALQAHVISTTYVPSKPSWYFFIFLGFLAGFSERLVPDFLGESEKGISPRTKTNAPNHDSVAGLESEEDETVQSPVITA